METETCRFKSSWGLIVGSNLPPPCAPLCVDVLDGMLVSPVSEFSRLTLPLPLSSVSNWAFSIGWWVTSSPKNTYEYTERHKLELEKETEISKNVHQTTAFNEADRLLVNQSATKSRSSIVQTSRFTKADMSFARISPYLRGFHWYDVILIDNWSRECRNIITKNTLNVASWRQLTTDLDEESWA